MRVKIREKAEIKEPEIELIAEDEKEVLILSEFFQAGRLCVTIGDTTRTLVLYPDPLYPDPF